MPTQKPKLTGGVIFFIVWVGVTSLNGLGALGNAERIWKPHMADYPSLHGAVLTCQLLSGAGISAWLYTAWLLYQREPGTLRKAQTSLVVGAALRLVGVWSIVLFGGLSKDMLRGLTGQLGFGTCVLLLISGVWYYYLLSSERVREIYAG